MLKDALASVLTQSYTDFEVIVGNDYTAERLTCDMLGISDSRVRIVNHPENLKEVGNMNALLGLATGRYFTWLFDDDLYEPDFLQTAHDCLMKSGFPPALFSSFRMLKPAEKYHPEILQHNSMIEFTGRDFLRWYSARRPKIASTCGFFDAAALKKVVGGVEDLCGAAIGIYCEYLFLVRCALLGRIVYIDAPYYVFRRHADSASECNVDLENHLLAGQELVRRCGDVLRHPALAGDYSANLMKICTIHVITFVYLTSRFEFTQNKFEAGALYRALSRHLHESLRTRRLYIREGGDNGLRPRIEFFKVIVFCWYLLVRHFVHFFNRGAW
jgi:glycosyltransferase involved in cell wall biosynthesis